MASTKMRRKDIIDILCEFEILHDKNLEDYGEIDFDKKKIYIRPQLPDLKRDTIIHELLHTHYYLKNNEDLYESETKVMKQTKRLYDKIYRGKK